ncbi:MAG: hypothetical protein QXU64_01980, partial [Thermofilaceae archaeon]
MVRLVAGIDYDELRRIFREELQALATDGSLRALVVNAEALARLVRWGRDVSPLWVVGAEVSAPAAGTSLVSVTVSPGKQGYIYGFAVTATEANSFRIRWTSGGVAYSYLIHFP